MSVVYSRDALLSCRHVAAVSKSMFINRLGECGLLRYRGSRGGRLTHLRAAAQSIQKVNNDAEIPNLNRIPAIVGNNAVAGLSQVSRTKRSRDHRINRRVNTIEASCTRLRCSELSVQSVYVLNAAGLSKQHAVEDLAADLSSYGVDVAIVTETHLGAKHADKIVSVPGYTLYRRDRSTPVSYTHLTLPTNREV